MTHEFRGSFFKDPKPKTKRKWSKKLPAKSAKRYSENEYRAAIRQQVFDRDGGCVLALEAGVGPCVGPDTPHHLLKASQGGGYTLDNLVTLCAGHNGWVEDHPDDAHARGLVIRREDVAS